MHLQEEGIERERGLKEETKINKEKREKERRKRRRTEE